MNNRLLRYKNFYPHIIGAFICIFLGMLSGYLSHASDSVWYMSLHKPCFNPPSWVFAPVWTILYCMMGIALGILWQKRLQYKKLLKLFILQLLCNLMWSPLFFYAQRIDFAFLDICILWVTLIIFMRHAYQEKLVWMLFIPYVAWVTFALILNFTIAVLNYKIV